MEYIQGNVFYTSHSIEGNLKFCREISVGCQDVSSINIYIQHATCI